MNKLLRILKEEIVKFLREYDDDIDYDLYDREDEIKQNLFQDFLYRNNSEFTKYVPWNLIPFSRLKKIWTDYMTTGVVRDERGLEYIEDIMTDNTVKIYLFTELTGHSQHDPEYDYEENINPFVEEQLNCIFDKPFDEFQLEIPFDNPQDKFKRKENTSKCNTTVYPYIQNVFDENYEEGMSRDEIHKIIYENLKDRFLDYYCEDPKIGHAYISDYGLEPLLNYLNKLRSAKTSEEKIPIIDKMLNVVHQRSDMAGWFVEGGSSALSQLSA